MSDTGRCSFVIRYAKEGGAPEKRRCAFCQNEFDARPAELGPELFIESTGELVCADCGWQRAPELVLAVQVAQCHREQESKVTPKEPQPETQPRKESSRGTDSGWHFG